MFNLGPFELVAIFVVALLVFGPDKLPEMGRQVGKAVREFRKFQASMQGQVRDVLDPITGPVSNGDVGPPATNIRGGPLPKGENVPRSATIQDPQAEEEDDGEPPGTYGHYALGEGAPSGAGAGNGDGAASDGDGDGAAPAGEASPSAGPPEPETR